MLKYLQKVLQTLWRETSKSKQTRKAKESYSYAITNEKTSIKPEILAPNVGNEKRDVENSKEIVKVKKTYDMLMKKFVNPKLDLSPSLKSLSTLEQIKLFDLKKKQEMLRTSVNNLLFDSKRKKRMPSLPQSDPEEDSKPVVAEESSYGWSGQPTSKQVFNTRIEMAVAPSGIDSAFFIFPEMEKFWNEKNQKSNKGLKSIFIKPKVKKNKKRQYGLKTKIAKPVELIKKIPKSHLCKFYEKDAQQLGKEDLPQEIDISCDFTKKHDSQPVNTSFVSRSNQNLLPSEPTKLSDLNVYSTSDKTQQNPQNETQLNDSRYLSEKESTQSAPVNAEEIILDTYENTNDTKQFNTVDVINTNVDKESPTLSPQSNAHLNHYKALKFLNEPINSGRAVEKIKDSKNINVSTKDLSPREKINKTLNERNIRDVSIPTENIVLAKESAGESKLVYKPHISSTPKSHKCDVLLSQKSSTPKSITNKDDTIPTLSGTLNESLLKNQASTVPLPTDKNVSKKREILKVHSNENVNTVGKKSEMNDNLNAKSKIKDKKIDSFQDQSADSLQSNVKTSMIKQQCGSRSGGQRKFVEIQKNLDTINNESQSDNLSKKLNVNKDKDKKENLPKITSTNRVTNLNSFKSPAENKAKSVVIKSDYLKFVKNKAWYYGRHSKRKARKSKSKESSDQVQDSSGEKLYGASNDLKINTIQKGNRTTKRTPLYFQNSKEKVLTSSQLPSKLEKKLANNISPSNSMVKLSANDNLKMKSHNYVKVIKSKLPLFKADEDSIGKSKSTVQISKRGRGLRRRRAFIAESKSNEPEYQKAKVTPYSIIGGYKNKSIQPANILNTRESSDKIKHSDLPNKVTKAEYTGSKTDPKTFTANNIETNDLAIKLDLSSMTEESFGEKRKLHSRKPEPKSINLKMYGIEKSTNIIPENEIKSLESVPIVNKKKKNKKQQKIEYPYLSLKKSVRRNQSNTVEPSSMALPTKIQSRNLFTFEYKANTIINYLWKRYASTAVNHIKSNKNLTNQNTDNSLCPYKSVHGISNILGRKHKNIKITKRDVFVPSLKSNINDKLKPGGCNGTVIDSKNVVSTIKKLMRNRVPNEDLGLKLSDKKTIRKYEDETDKKVNKSREKFEKDSLALSKMKQNKKDYSVEVLFTRQDANRKEMHPEKQIQKETSEIKIEPSLLEESFSIPSKFKNSNKNRQQKNQIKGSNNNLLQNVESRTKKTASFTDKHKETGTKIQNSCDLKLNSSLKTKSIAVEEKAKTKKKDHFNSDQQSKNQHSDINDTVKKSLFNQYNHRETPSSRQKLGKAKMEKLVEVNNLTAKSNNVETGKKSQEPCSVSSMKTLKKLKRLVFVGSKMPTDENPPRWKSRDDRLNGWSHKDKLRTEKKEIHSLKESHSKLDSTYSLKNSSFSVLKTNKNIVETTNNKITEPDYINKGLKNKTDKKGEELNKTLIASSLSEGNLKALKNEDLNLQKQTIHQAEGKKIGLKTIGVQSNEIVAKHLAEKTFVSEKRTDKSLKPNNLKETLVKNKSYVQDITLQNINSPFVPKVPVTITYTTNNNSLHKKEQTNTINTKECPKKKSSLENPISNISNINNKRNEKLGDKKKSLISDSLLANKNTSETIPKMLKISGQNNNNSVALHKKSLNRLSMKKVNPKLSKSETNHVKIVDVNPKVRSKQFSQGSYNPIEKKLGRVSENRFIKKDYININNDFGVNKYSNELYKGQLNKPKLMKVNTKSGQGDGLFNEQAKEIMSDLKEIKKTIPVSKKNTQAPKYLSVQKSFNTFSLTQAEIKNLLDKVQSNNLKCVTEKIADVTNQSIINKNDKLNELNNKKVKLNPLKNQFPLKNEFHGDTIIEFDNPQNLLQQKVHPIEKEKYGLEFVLQTPTQIKIVPSTLNTVTSQSKFPTVEKNTNVTASKSCKEGNKQVENKKQNQLKPTLKKTGGIQEKLL